MKHIFGEVLSVHRYEYEDFYLLRFCAMWCGEICQRFGVTLLPFYQTTWRHDIDINRREYVRLPRCWISVTKWRKKLIYNASLAINFIATRSLIYVNFGY